MFGKFSLIITEHLWFAGWPQWVLSEWSTLAEHEQVYLFQLKVREREIRGTIHSHWLNWMHVTKTLNTQKKRREILNYTVTMSDILDVCPGILKWTGSRRHESTDLWVGQVSPCLSIGCWSKWAHLFPNSVGDITLVAWNGVWWNYDIPWMSANVTVILWGYFISESRLTGTSLLAWPHWTCF